ncbi:MAG: dehydrogenase [Candidatus Brocadiia bacterium]|jgi:D-glycero-alpha-D-manno-heptose-7-phosphate kinase
MANGNGNGLYEVEIISQAPTRISLAGGGTDVSPYPEQFGGEVVNATISVFMLARLRLSRDPTVIIHANTRPQPMVYPSFKDMAFDGQLDFIKAAAQAMYDGRGGFELFVYSSLPMRSGLGGSGAMCMAVLGAFNAARHGKKLNNYDLAELAYEIETVRLGNASGRQDQYAAAFGGFNHFEFLGGNKVRTRPLDIGRAGERILNQALLLFWLGERKASGGIIEDQRTAMKNGGRSLEAFHASKMRVAEMREALEDVDVERIGGLLHLLWQQKKQFSKDVSNPAIDAIYERLSEAGMTGGKITGAGGGGHMVACCSIEKRDSVLEAAAELKIRNVPFSFVQEGQISWQAPIRTITGPARTEPTSIPMEQQTALRPALLPECEGVLVREVNHTSSRSQRERIPEHAGRQGGGTVRPE